MKNYTEPKYWPENLKRLRSLEYIPQAHIDFFEHISEAHYRAKARLLASSKNIYPPVSREKAQEMLSHGFPLINFDRMNIREELLREHLKEICGILGKYEKLGQMEPATGEYMNLEELIRKTLFHESPAESTDESPDENVNAAVALALARPLFELAATEMKDILADYSWWRGYCPACGSLPLIAKIRREDGMRILHCSVCAVEWKFTRVKCPFCNNEEQKSLKFFYYHEEDSYRLYVCDRCRRYIKCVDERKMEQSEEIDLSIEDMVTLYLDVLAREKEYLPLSINPCVNPAVNRSDQPCVLP